MLTAKTSCTAMSSPAIFSSPPPPLSSWVSQDTGKSASFENGSLFLSVQEILLFL